MISIRLLSVTYPFAIPSLFFRGFQLGIFKARIQPLFAHMAVWKVGEQPCGHTACELNVCMHTPVMRDQQLPCHVRAVEFPRLSDFLLGRLIDIRD